MFITAYFEVGTLMDSSVLWEIVEPLFAYVNAVSPVTEIRVKDCVLAAHPILQPLFLPLD